MPRLRIYSSWLLVPDSEEGFLEGREFRKRDRDGLGTII